MLLRKIAIAASMTAALTASIATSQVPPPSLNQSATSEAFVLSADGTEQALTVDLETHAATVHSLSLTLGQASTPEGEPPEYAYEVEVIRADAKEPTTASGSHQGAPTLNIPLEPVCKGDVCEHSERLLVRVHRTDLGTDDIQLVLIANAAVQYPEDSDGPGADFVKLAFVPADAPDPVDEAP